jgi:peroxiredoxin
MVHLQKLHKKYGDKGLVILGLNWADDKKIALEFLRENSATFPTILDSSQAARDIVWRGYKASGVPVSYIIDREGKIADAWSGYETGHKRALNVLERLGLIRTAAANEPARQFATEADEPNGMERR